jgi:hypothetical protein
MDNSAPRFEAQFGYALVALSVVFSVAIAVSAEASTPDDTRLFWKTLRLVFADSLLIAFVCSSKNKVRIWLVAVPALIALLFYLDLGLRVYLGKGIL